MMHKTYYMVAIESDERPSEDEANKMELAIALAINNCRHEGELTPEGSELDIGIISVDRRPELDN